MGITAGRPKEHHCVDEEVVQNVRAGTTTVHYLQVPVSCWQISNGAFLHYLCNPKGKTNKTFTCNLEYKSLTNNFYLENRVSVIEELLISQIVSCQLGFSIKMLIYTCWSQQTGNLPNFSVFLIPSSLHSEPVAHSNAAARWA